MLFAQGIGARPKAVPTETTSLQPKSSGGTEVSVPTCRAYGVLALLALLKVLCSCDKHLLSAFANFIIPELELTVSQFGALLGIGYVLSYSIMDLIAGPLVDICPSRPLLLTAGIFVWSLLTGVCGGVHGFAGLLLTRIFVGVGESVLGPVAISYVAELFPPAHRGFPDGCFASGGNLGGALALIFAGALGETLGWRWIFGLLGMFGMVVGLTVPLFLKEGNERRAITVREAATGLQLNLRLGLRVVTGCVSLRCLLPGTMVMTIPGTVIGLMQPFLTEERGASRSEAALVSGYVMLAAGVIGNPLVGWLADVVCRRFGYSQISFAGCVTLVVMLPAGLGFLLSKQDASPAFWTAYAFYIIGSSIQGVWFSIVQDLSPPHLRGTIIGLMICVLSLFDGVWKLLAGLSVDYLKDNEAPRPYATALVIFTVMQVLVQSVSFFLTGYTLKEGVRWIDTVASEFR